jgi:2-hydroxychromene-2-carboxylate isomerase
MPVNIHGKEYLTVAERVGTFRDKHPNYSIITEIIDNSDGYIVMLATIKNGELTIATGHAQEKYGSSNINQTSALENCETSAIGRALAAFGLAGSEFASADEVSTAIQQQSAGVSYNRVKMASDKQKKMIRDLYVQQDGDPELLTQYIEGEGFDPKTLTTKQASQLIESLQG